VAFLAPTFPQLRLWLRVFLAGDIGDFLPPAPTRGAKAIPKNQWQPLQNVLPKNIWLYVFAIPNLAATPRALLQGGTQLTCCW